MKPIFLICLISMLISCKKNDTWYSAVDRDKIIKDDKDFFLNKENYNENLIFDLKNFKNLLINRKIDGLYDYQTENFKKIVSKSVYGSELLGRTDLPDEVYFTNDSLHVENNKATMKVFYVYINPKFTYCVESNDIWLVSNEGNWKFFSNMTPWGSNITSN